MFSLYGWILCSRCFHVNYCAELKESHVNLKLTIVDTVGFADQIDKTDRYVQSRRDLYR